MITALKSFHCINVLMDFSSCHVGRRKPDPGIFHLAMGIAQAQPDECVYFDDRLMLVQAAQKLGIHSFHHQDFETTKENIINLKK